MNKKGKKVLLINPPESLAEAERFFNPPLGLLYLAGTLLSEGIETQIIDGFFEGWEAIEKKIKDYQPNIVGISCFTPPRHKSFKAAKIAKKINNNILVVMGGMHVTHMYRQVLSHYPFIDVCVLGEGERTLSEIAQDKELSEIKGIAFRKNGEIFLTAPRENIKNLDELPFPAWHLVDWQKYPKEGKGTVNGIVLAEARRTNVTFSRGCIGYCNFCSVWRVWGRWRHRSPKNMIDEVEILNKKFNITHLNFTDDSFTIDKQAILGLCDEINKRNLKIAFSTATRTDCVDREVLLALKNAGCYKIEYGVESAAPAILKGMNKPIDIGVSKKAISLSKQVGIRTVALLIVGYLGETVETINQTVDFLKDVQPDRIGTRPGLFIFPGTNDYYRCQRMKFVNDDFWLTKKRYKVYTAEHNKLSLAVFYIAVRNLQKLSQRQIVNYFKYLPYFIRMRIADYLPEPVRIKYHNLKIKIFNLFQFKHV